MGARLPLLLLAVVAAALAWAAAAPAEPALGLAQLAGADGCTTMLADPRGAQADEEDEDAGRSVKGCRRAKALDGASSVALSPDGANVYVAATGSGSVSVFRREAPTGRLVETSCVTYNGTDGRDGTERACADGDALAGAVNVTVSGDGKNVYVVGAESDGIAVFSRDAATGRLTQIGCVRSIRTCTGARGLAGASSLALSPDGKSAYLASYGADAVLTLARDGETGALKPLGCISDDGTDRMCANGNALRGANDVVVSPDGRHVYVAAASSDAVLTFTRDAETGALTQAGCVMDTAPKSGSCVRVRALDGPVALAMTPDGRTLFAGSSESSSLAVFARDAASGRLREIGCVSNFVQYEDEKPPNDGCAHVSTMYGLYDVTLTSDARRLYVATGSGLTVFDRDLRTGVLAPAGCVTVAGYYDENVEKQCTIGRAVTNATGVAVAPDGRNVYVTSWDDDAVSTFVPAAAVAFRAGLVARTTLAARVYCPAEKATACTGAVTVTRGGRAVAAARRFELRPGTSIPVRVRLSRAALRAYARGGRLSLVVAATDRSRVAAPSLRKLVLARRTHAAGRPPPRARP